MNASTKNIYRNVVPVVFLALIALLIFYMRGILGAITVAVVLFVFLDPIVGFSQGRRLFGAYRISHTMGVIIAMLFATLLTAVIFVILIPPIVDQVNRVTGNFSEYVAIVERQIDQFQDDYERISMPQFVDDQIESGLERLSDVFVSIMKSGVSMVGGFFSHIIVIVMIPFITFYLLLEKDDFKNTIIGILPAKRQQEIADIFHEIGESFRGYLIGQLFLSVLMWLLVWVGLSMLRVKAPLLLGLVAGLTKMIPVIGIFLGGVPATLVAFANSPMTAMWVIIVFTAVQLLENKIILPLFLSRYVHLSPLAIMIALLVGEELGGVLGMFLCTPIASIVKITYTHIRRRYD